MVIQTRSGDDAVLPNLMLARREVTKFLTDEKWHAVSMSSPLAVFPLILRKAIPGYEDKSTAADRIQILKHMFAN